MPTLFFDCETRSACDLKAHGSYVYSGHETTSATCVTYAIDEGPVKIWKIIEGEPLPSDFPSSNAGWTVVGHNFVNFDRLIWERVLKLPPLEADQICDTMVRCYAMGLPGSLDQACQALNLKHQKDMKASRVMLQLAKPKNDDPLEWYLPEKYPEKFSTLYEYAIKDVEAMRELYHATFPLQGREKPIFALDLKMNSIGVPVDVESCKLAVGVVEAEKARLDCEMKDITENAVGACLATSQIVNWVKSQGIECTSIAKNEVEKLLKSNIPPKVEAVLRLRQKSAKASTAKLQAVLDRQVGGYVQGAFQYSGANTRRWAGRGAQFQNWPRGKASDDFFDSLKDGSISWMYDSPIEIISNNLRGFIKAPEGKKLLGADFSAIEARALAWLAGQEDILEVFRGDGKIYEFAASQIYDLPIEAINSEQRQIGKVASLALGYGGGSKAFQNMARIYGLDITEDRAEQIKSQWREKNSNIVSYWREIQNTAIDAVSADNEKWFKTKHKERLCKFRIVRKADAKYLLCQLPSSGLLYYPDPKIEEVTTQWGERNQLSYMTVDSLTRKWVRNRTYGGSLVENITQSLARDLLAETMVRLAQASFDVVATIHDEVLCIGDQDSKLSELINVMEIVPEWAKGLPLKAEGWEGFRYG